MTGQRHHQFPNYHLTQLLAPLGQNKVDLV